MPLRRRELQASCEVLGVSQLELLGYHDSGMDGWPQNDAPDSFWRTPVEDSAARLAELMRRYEPQVVVTYDENGFYGHPDHIQANPCDARRVGGIGDRGQAVLHRGRARGDPAVPHPDGRGRHRGPEEVADNPDFGTPDELITTVVDVTAVAGRKYASLGAHASQSDNIFFLQMGEEMFASVMGSESFVRVTHDGRAGPRGRPLRRTALSGRVHAFAGRGRRPSRPGRATAATPEHDRRGDLEGEGLLGEGGEPRLFEPEEPVHHRDQEPGQGGERETDADQRRPEATHDDHSEPDQQAGDGLEEEQGTDGGNGAVPVVPEVVMDGGGPHEQQSSDGEHRVGDQVAWLSGAPGPPRQQLQVQALGRGRAGAR